MTGLGAFCSLSGYGSVVFPGDTCGAHGEELAGGYLGLHTARLPGGVRQPQEKEAKSI